MFTTCLIQRRKLSGLLPEVNKVKHEQRAEVITAEIYAAYASSTGHLFGITPELRHAVKAIVDTTIDIMERE